MASLTPIFDELAQEFAEQGKRYEDMTRPILMPTYPKLYNWGQASQTSHSWFTRPQSRVDDTIPLAVVQEGDMCEDDLPNYIEVKPLPHKND